MSYDSPPDQPLSTVLPTFDPVPRAKDRANGWKPEVQRAFIEALAETGSVRAACRSVNRADHGAYLLRRHPEAQAFCAAWDPRRLPRVPGARGCPGPQLADARRPRRRGPRRSRVRGMVRRRPRPPRAQRQAGRYADVAPRGGRQGRRSHGRRGEPAISIPPSAHPEPVEGPDFLKQGDPALTFPHGKTYGVNHPHCRLGGVPNLPGPITRNELARDWLGHVAAGRIGG